MSKIYSQREEGEVCGRIPSGRSYGGTLKRSPDARNGDNVTWSGRKPCMLMTCPNLIDVIMNHGNHNFLEWNDVRYLRIGCRFVIGIGLKMELSGVVLSGVSIDSRLQTISLSSQIIIFHPVYSSITFWSWKSTFTVPLQHAFF